MVDGLRTTFPVSSFLASSSFLVSSVIFLQMDEQKSIFFFLFNYIFKCLSTNMLLISNFLNLFLFFLFFLFMFFCFG